MTSNLMRRSEVAFALVAVAALATAQPPAAQPPAAQPPAVRPLPGTAQPAPGTAQPVPSAFRVKQLLNTKISIQGNVAIGTVDDIVISDAGEVEYLIVNNDNKLVTVPWSAATFNFEKQTAVVNLTAAQYRAIPTYTVTTYPQFFTPTYRAEVYKTYGLTPGQFRRLERRIEAANQDAGRERP